MKDFLTPHALDAAELPGITDDHRRAAADARAAGFDGVEVHPANNHLLERFVRDGTNRRLDEHGGPIADRLRFPLAVIRAVIEVWGADRVRARISPTTTEPGGTPPASTVMETSGAYLKAFSQLGVLYVHGIEGTTRGAATCRTASASPRCGGASRART